MPSTRSATSERPEENRQQLEEKAGTNEKTQKLEPNIGDIVLLCEDGQTRSNWPMGRILELYPSSDGMKRSALVKTAAGTLVRSIRKMQLIEPAAV
ncbi:hypothetical protein T03_849 [Trichinella britovi]|uniref:DUF5641 domain-containing protein n=1 Tax=Trichinella britovi TaxID=45882 RepID=A0A0V1DDF4_TRIBR|nr:hypothetical protein T03_849 [Trichinella britovi]